jgi:microsomal dipeptidase-like Zn-dependent dipeptidase
MQNFRYTDLHCHPNLKTFGHSFSGMENPKADLWYTKKPDILTKKIYEKTGITKFSQTDLSTMSKAKGKIAFVSLYPFEKGFFHNPYVFPKLAAQLANWGIEIGYQRIRYIQKHNNYFHDLKKEYQFFLNSKKEGIVENKLYKWKALKNLEDVDLCLNSENELGVIFTVEGAHVFNTGLEDYGRPNDKDEVLENIQEVKTWEHVPLFIGLAHNFNNDLCGHARSLQRLGNLVNQEKNMDIGLTPLGKDVIRELLSDKNGKRIFIDLKHMSLASRLDYYKMLEEEYGHKKIPLVVSHGALTGTSISQIKFINPMMDIFNENDLNFFDEEVELVARSNGLFALQMDLNIQTDLKKINGFFSKRDYSNQLKKSAQIIWNQLQHFALICDRNGLFAWGNTCLGTDFDGSINPFPGVLTAEGLAPLAKELTNLVNEFLKKKKLFLKENYEISPEEIIERFFYHNTVEFTIKTFGLYEK